MRSTSSLPSLRAVLLSLAVLTACSEPATPPFTGGDVACEDDACTCQPANECVGECPEGGCALACSDGEYCNTTCGKDCDLACMRVQSCITSCGDGCVQTCENTGSCEFVVGAGSDVLCRRVGTCEVICNGPCRVDCEASGSCDVTCEGGSPAPICPNGTTRVCNTAC